MAGPSTDRLNYFLGQHSRFQSLALCLFSDLRILTGRHRICLPLYSQTKTTDVKGAIMLKGELSGRFGQLKNKVQNFWVKISDQDFESARKGVSQVFAKFQRLRDHEVKPHDVHIDNYHYESHRIDDMPLTMAKDPGPGIKYGLTDNSRFARGADKVAAVGIDSFGEDNAFNPDEGDEHQDFLKRNSTSDLDQGYFSHGS